MAAVQRFRSAFNGFNREDVVHYIEYLNNQHKSQTEQLNTQLQAALAKATPADLQAQLDAALARCTELEAALAAKGAPTDSELEAYRRAERAERMAQERAAQIYAQANAVLADATCKVESAAEGMKVMAQQVSAQVEASQQQLQEAVTAMYAIRPTE